MLFDKRLHQGIRRGEITCSADLLKVAQHGRGENVYLVTFHYVEPVRRRR